MLISSSAREGRGRWLLREGRTCGVIFGGYLHRGSGVAVGVFLKQSEWWCLSVNTHRLRRLYSGCKAFRGALTPTDI
eukprot:scaffold5967_cov53-Phaeocystis_antarctica.AAC.2